MTRKKSDIVPVVFVILREERENNISRSQTLAIK